MTTRQVAVQGALAVVGLCAAYFTWQRGAELEPGQVFVVDATKNELAEVRFDDQEKSSWVELTRSSDAAGSFIAVHLSAQEKPVPGKEKETTKTPERLLRGSDAADKLFGSFAPLRASRALGVLDADKLKALGLDAPKKHLILALKNGKRSFAIAPAPAGGSEPYLRDEANGQVYLIARNLLSDFQVATSMLVERHLHAFKVEEVDRMVVTRGSKKKEFVITPGEGGVRVAAASSPDKPDATAKTWHDRVFGLWPVDVLGKDEAPAEGAPEPELRIDYRGRGRSLGFVEVAKVAAPVVTSTENAKAAKDTLFAKSEHTLGWFKLSMDGQTLLGDVDTVLR